MRPERIRQDSPTEIRIDWDDAHAGRHTTAGLRAACPCASCKAEREPGGEGTLLPILVPGKTVLTAIVPVGSYALQLAWGDGHRTGIYTYEFLRRICECERCLADPRTQR